jgi:hypothetical protein
MSTIQKVNFTPVTSVLPLQIRDFPIADQTLINPLNALCVIDGEWLTLDPGGSNKAVRAADVGTLGALATTRSFPLFAERGRYDIQAMSKKGVPLIYRGEYEFDTRIFDASVALGAGAAITFPLQPLKAATIAIGGRNYTGLVGHGGTADVSPVVGYVTRLPASNSGQLRFMSGWRS